MSKSPASATASKSVGAGLTFDATLKHLLEMNPRAWAKLLGAGDHEHVELVDSDLSTVSPRADKVFRFVKPEPWLMHVEFQASYDSQIDWRTLQYQVLLVRREQLPVHSVVVLLRAEANGPATSGVLTCQDFLDGAQSLWFRYRVIRLWEISVEELLSADLALLPLAPIANVSLEEIPTVIEKMEKRFAELSSDTDRKDFWTSTYLLMGLKFSKTEAYEFLKGISAMKESTTYQAILEEGAEKGRVEEARRLVLKIGSKKFGSVKPDVEYLINQKSDLAEIERLHERLMDVSSWDELLNVN